MRWRHILTEVIHLAAGLVVTRLVFVAAAWAYPQGREAIAPIGWLTMLAVLAMSVPELMKAWHADTGRKTDLG
jgi:hypothetical protein